jgi:hypothetical protein
MEGERRRCATALTLIGRRGQHVWIVVVAYSRAPSSHHAQEPLGRGQAHRGLLSEPLESAAASHSMRRLQGPAVPYQACSRRIHSALSVAHARPCARPSAS